MTRKYPRPDVKLLYGRAALRCAFSQCRKELAPDDEDNPRFQIGKIAHIIGHSSDGPRGDGNYPISKLDSYDNWVLLCPNCHDTVDAQNEKYTIQLLRTVKTEHEHWVRVSLSLEMPNIGFAELEVVAKGIVASPKPISSDFSVTPPLEKMNKNGLTQQVHGLISMGLSRNSEVREFINQYAEIDQDFPERLKDGFVVEYDRLKMNNVLGDDLFEGLWQFASGGNTSDFKRSAAGLAILSYLFESCEVFEK